MAADRNRNRFWVNSHIQGRILARIAAYWVVYHAILWHAMFVVRYVAYRAALITGDGEYQSIGQIYSKFTSDFSTLLICAVLLAPAFMYDMIRNTHRICGPLVRFQNSLKKMIAGEKVAPFKLRDHDLLVQFQDVFNEFLEYYNAKVANLPAGEVKLSSRDAAILEQIAQLRAMAPDPLAADAPNESQLAEVSA
jgi:hypothetical protein